MAAFLPTRDSLGLFLNDLALVGDGLEVGAYRGEFATKVLSNWHGRSWTLLDPWDEITPEALITNNVGWDMPSALKACQQLAEKDARCKLARPGSIEEAAIPVPLDCVYLDAMHDARNTLEAMERWWPRVRPGGILSGHDYVDGWLRRGCLFGVQTAVDHFARRHRRVVSVAADKDWPTWWFRKPVGKPGSVAVVSGSTVDVTWRELTHANHRWYCEQNGYPYFHVTFKRGAHGDRPPAWDKIAAVREALRDHDWVMWIDADAVFQRSDIPLEWFWDGVSPMLWTGDAKRGLNTGVFFARRCDETCQFLDRWEAMGEDQQFRFHLWWENKAAKYLQRKRDLPGLMLPAQPANSFPHRSSEGLWRANDLVAHPCGVKNPLRHAMLADLAYRAALSAS